MTQRLLTQAESHASLVALLKLDAAGEPGDAAVRAQLDRVLDVGTGVGVLAVAFCRRFPNATVVGIDPRELSLEMARQNVAAAGFDSRITLRQTRIEALSTPLSQSRASHADHTLVPRMSPPETPSVSPVM